jgi:hypothetical protein
MSVHNRMNTGDAELLVCGELAGGAVSERIDQATGEAADRVMAPPSPPHRTGLSARKHSQMFLRNPPSAVHAFFTHAARTHTIALQPLDGLWFDEVAAVDWQALLESPRHSGALETP